VFRRRVPVSLERKAKKRKRIKNRAAFSAAAHLFSGAAGPPRRSSIANRMISNRYSDDL